MNREKKQLYAFADAMDLFFDLISGMITIVMSEVALLSYSSVMLQCL